MYPTLVTFILEALVALIVTGGITGGIRLLLWVKEVKSNHLPHLQAAMEAIPPALEKQTEIIVRALGDNTKEISEQRSDIRLLVGKL